MCVLVTCEIRLRCECLYAIVDVTDKGAAFFPRSVLFHVLLYFVLRNEAVCANLTLESLHGSLMLAIDVCLHSLRKFELFPTNWTRFAARKRMSLDVYGSSRFDLLWILWLASSLRLALRYLHARYQGSFARCCSGCSCHDALFRLRHTRHQQRLLNELLNC